jgi:hypothetical protein
MLWRVISYRHAKVLEKPGSCVFRVEGSAAAAADDDDGCDDAASRFL